MSILIPILMQILIGPMAMAAPKDPRTAALQKEVKAAELTLKRAQSKNTREQKMIAAFEKREGGKKSETMLAGCDAQVCLHPKRCTDADLEEAFRTQPGPSPVPDSASRRMQLMPQSGSKKRGTSEAMAACWAVFEAHNQKFKGLSLPCQNALMTCSRIQWTANWIRQHEIALDAEKALGIAERQLIEAREQLAELPK